MFLVWEVVSRGKGSWALAKGITFLLENGGAKKGRGDGSVKTRFERRVKKISGGGSCLSGTKKKGVPPPLWVVCEASE